MKRILLNKLSILYPEFVSYKRVSIKMPSLLCTRISYTLFIVWRHRIDKSSTNKDWVYSFYHISAWPYFFQARRNVTLTIHISTGNVYMAVHQTIFLLCFSFVFSLMQRSNKIFDTFKKLSKLKHTMINIFLLSEIGTVNICIVVHWTIVGLYSSYIYVDAKGKQGIWYLLRIDDTITYHYKTFWYLKKLLKL